MPGDTEYARESGGSKGAGRCQGETEGPRGGVVRTIGTVDVNAWVKDISTSGAGEDFVLGSLWCWCPFNVLDPSFFFFFLDGEEEWPSVCQCLFREECFEPGVDWCGERVPIGAN